MWLQFRLRSFGRSSLKLTAPWRRLSSTKWSEQGLCLGDFMVLEVLLHKGPLTMSAIGEKVLLANASMTSAMWTGWKRRSWRVRKNNSEDRRVRVVELTPHGKKLISEIYRRHEHELEALMCANCHKAERSRFT